MRILVISDIHANLTAFQAVLDAAAGQWDTIWCLGDVVGYGPDPNECVALLREQEHVGLTGNHDWAVLGRLSLDAFNDVARAAISWTQSVLRPENHLFLEELPPLVELDNFTLVHASPREPIWEYVLDARTAAANFKHFTTPFCLMGHSHIPLFFIEDAAAGAVAYLPHYDAPIQLDDERLMINPGSVGQPRDHDPRAAFALLDTDTLTWTHRRVAYDVEETQRRMRAVDLPERLVQRLSFGY